MSSVSFPLLPTPGEAPFRRQDLDGQMTNTKEREFDLIANFGGESPRPTINHTATTAGGSHVPSSQAEVRLGITRHFLKAPRRGTLWGGKEPNGHRGSAAPALRGAPPPPPLRSRPGLDSDRPPCCWSAARPGPGPARTAGRAGGAAGGRVQEARWAGAHLVLDWWPAQKSSPSSELSCWWSLESWSQSCSGWGSEPQSAHRARPGRRRPKAAGGRAPTSRSPRWCSGESCGALRSVRPSVPCGTASESLAPTKARRGHVRGPRPRRAGAGRGGAGAGRGRYQLHCYGRGSRDSERKSREAVLHSERNVARRLARRRKLFSLPSDYHPRFSWAVLVPAIGKAPTRAWMEQPTWGGAGVHPSDQGGRKSAAPRDFPDFASRTRVRQALVSVGCV